MDNEKTFEYEDEKVEEVISCDIEKEAEEVAEEAPKEVESSEAECEEAPEEVVLDKKQLQKKEKLKAKRKKWKVWYIVLLCLAGFWTTVLIMAGGIALMDYFLTMEEVVDIDESFELSDLTEKQIISKHSYCIASSYKFFTNGFGYSYVDYDYEAYDSDECYFEATNFSGIRTVCASYAEESYIIFTIDAQSTASSDDIKIVITTESEILVEFDANSPIMYTVKNDDTEHIFVKVLGDQADLSITVTRRIVGFDENPDA